MEYVVRLKRSAEKELLSVPAKFEKLIRKALIALSDNPMPRGCEKLKGSPYYRIRIGDYRAIYKITKAKTVVVMAVGHRKDIYRKDL